MYGKVKLSKRQIKEDKFTAFILNAKHQFMENWQFVIIGVVIFILIIVGFVYYLDSQEAQHIDAGNRYSNALMDFANGNTEEALVKLDQIIEDYSGDSFSEKAIFQMAKIQFENKNYPEASRYFELYLCKYKIDKWFRSASLAGIASCLENQGNYAEAALKFDEAYNEFSDGPSTGDYLTGAMRNYLETGDFNNATTMLDKIKEDFEKSQIEKKAILLFTEKSRS